MSTLLLHAWSVRKKGEFYFLPYTHWIYLKEIKKYYDKIVLLSPVKYGEVLDGYKEITHLSPKIGLFELPSQNGYISAIKYFFDYIIAYNNLSKSNFDTIYTRYPTPFGWLQKVFFRNKKRIIHFVGDPINAAVNNPNFSVAKKKFLITAFKPEKMLYEWACKGAIVFTNGHHIADKLRKKNIYATPLISSTLNENDFYFETNKQIDFKRLRFIYLGYLRRAKGVETIIDAFGKFQLKYQGASLSIIGSGEFETYLKRMVENKQYKNITFKGHIDDREQINLLLRKHDVFLFGSLSEGSPRAVLEAMANGLVVISTPVGSLPNIFTHGEDILFAEFGSALDFVNRIDELIRNKNLYYSLRWKSNTRVRAYTITSFIKNIFYDS